MKKKSLFVLLFSLFLMLVGGALFLFSYFQSDFGVEPIRYTVQSQLQWIEIDLKNTELVLLPSEDTTYLEISGYTDNEFFISETDGKMQLTDQSEKASNPIKLGGLGKLIKESRRTSKEKRMTLYINQETLDTPISIVLKESTFTSSAPVKNLSLNAEKSKITADHLMFDRFDAKLTLCQSSFVIDHEGNSFSRSIETYDTLLSLNDDQRANTDFYQAGDTAPIFIVNANGGSCALLFPNHSVNDE